MSTKGPKIRAVLFDMDGLLLDTERVYTQVTQGILDRFGQKFEWSLKSKMMGLKERDAARLLIETLGIPLTEDEYLMERNAGHAALFPHCKPLPGVLRLVQHLYQHGIPMCVATSSHRKAFEVKSSNNQALFSLFAGNVICGDDASIKQGKPAPDIFEAAARKLFPEFKTSSSRLGNLEDDCLDPSLNPAHIQPSEILVFEDALSGLAAAGNGGFPCVLIPDPNMLTALSLGEWTCPPPISILASMDEFVPEQYGLPPFSSTTSTAST